VNDYKVLITTSGTGSRLGQLTEYTNKALIRVGTKPAISHIIENYSDQTRFVITLGHKGKLVRNFLEIAYPHLDIEFVEVDLFNGPGSSMGYSMLKARELLDCPFIFHACDSIVAGILPRPTSNWLGYSDHNVPCHSEYVTLMVKNQRIHQLRQKGERWYNDIYIGILGIADYEIFWSSLERLYWSDPESAQLSDYSVVSQMISEHGTEFKAIRIENWKDTGNHAALDNTRASYGEDINYLEKKDESTFIWPDKVIKFFSDEAIARKRVERNVLLGDTVPVVGRSSPHYYSYGYVPGKVVADRITTGELLALLDWCNAKLWKELPLQEKELLHFHNGCMQFYRNKTLERVDAFLTKEQIQSDSTIINGVEVPSLAQALDRLPWEELSRGIPVTFHGDLHFENILIHEKGFTLLDWRHEFAPGFAYGDLYYDLAKLHHGMEINHGIIRSGRYEVQESGGEVWINIHRLDHLLQVQSAFHQWVHSMGWDLRRIKLLTNLIYLNIAALHHDPYNRFLYYYGRLNLERLLREPK